MVEGWSAPPTPQWADVGFTAGRQRRARATRRALLLAAARLIDEHGYHGASLNDVAAAAGTTKGAVYFHFPSKRALAEALFDEVSASWDELVAQIEAQGHDPLRTLLICYDAYAGELMHDSIARASVRVVREADLVHAALWVPRWQKTIADLLDRARDEGLLQAHTDPRWLSRHILATTTGNFQLASNPATGMTMWDRMNDTWAGLMPAVATPEWVAGWRVSGWRERSAPRSEDYARTDLLGD